MMSPALQLIELRKHLAASLGPVGERVLAQPLAQLDALIQAEDGDPAKFGPLLDEVEDLVEALLHEAGWAEAGGQT